MIYRNATQSDVQLMLDWAAKEGWNPGLSDAAAFYQADPKGFFVAVSNGTPVAAISVVNHTDTFAFLGLYIVLPAHRGRGIGFDLWQHALKHAEGRVVGLDGVPEQQKNYAASGFEKAGGTTRFAGKVAGREDADHYAARIEDIPDLITLEASASGVRKQNYLTAWFRDASDRRTFRSRSVASACVTVRACHEGAKIGPLIAPDADVADRLLRHAAAQFPGPVVIDVPNAALGLADVCRKHNMTPGFETARMYRGKFEPPKAPVFAVTSLELG